MKNILSRLKFKLIPLIVFTGLCVFVSPAHSQQTSTVQTLKPSANGRFIIKADGTPFFWLGDTAWSIATITPAEVTTYMNDRASKNFTVIHVDADAYNAKNFEGQRPFFNDNPDQPNEAWWRHIDYIISQAEAKGLYVCLFTMWGRVSVPNDQGGVRWLHGYARFNGSTTRAYSFGRWLGNRYKARKNIIWSVAGEYNKAPGSDFALMDAVARGLEDAHGGTQLMTIHSMERSSKDFHTKEWLDFNMVQSGHQADNTTSGTRPETYAMVTSDYNLTPAKPTLDGEPNYEQAGNVITPADVRRKTYWSVFAGGFGVTYGHMAVEDMLNPLEGDLGLQWKTALNAPGAGQMRHLRALIESYPFLTRVPDQSVIASAPGTGIHHVRATRDSQGSYALVYIPTGGNVTINMNKIVGGSVKASWFNPRDGSFSAIGTFPNTGTKSFDAPGAVADGNDWVLVLEKPAATTATTGSSTNITPNSATLNATVNPNGSSTTVYFQYGTNSGNFTSKTTSQTLSGSSPVNVTANITGLSSGTNYYYYPVATNSAGTVYGNKLSFTTLTASDTAKPAGSVSINSGASSTASTAVTLTLSARDNAGVTGYYLSNNATAPLASSAGWIAVPATANLSKTVSHTLTSGAGTKTVYAWYKDAAGNVSLPYSDSIELTTSASGSEPHPNMFINSREIAAIKEKAASGLAPWEADYDLMIQNANAALITPAQSVTFGGKTPLSGNIHDFYVDPTYIKDGVPYPDRDKYDLEAFQKFAGAVRKLGLAYAFTGQAKYADKAISLIRTFCLDPSTKMNPKYTVYDSYIIFPHQGSILLYGIDLILNYPGWKETELTAFKAWIKTISILSPPNVPENNFGNWLILFKSAAGVVLEDKALRQWAFDEWKKLMEVQIRDDGAFIHELTRTNSLGYSEYALQPMTMAAEIARHHGVNLYDFKLSNGRSLEMIFDYHAPYFMNPSTWPYRQDKAYSGAGLAAFEAAYLWKQKAAYKAVLDKWGRPFDYLGLITLTHAFGAYSFSLDQPLPQPDTSRPTGSVSINSGAASTTSTAVTLTLTASDNTGVTGYYVSNDSTAPPASSTGWISVPSTTSLSKSLSHNLTSGAGTKTVYAWYKDAAGNVSTAAKDSITLDIIAPRVSITSPENGSTLTTTPVNFEWSAGADGSVYWLYAGKSKGTKEYYNSGETRATRATISGLPWDGSRIYVRLWHKAGSQWQYNDYSYKTKEPETIIRAAEITSPAPGSVLAGPSVNFEWSSISHVSACWLYVGKFRGTREYYNSGETTAAKTTVSGLPQDGSSVYVRLWYKVGSKWLYRDYSYATNKTETAASTAEITSPAPGAALAGPSVNFEWSAGSNVSVCWLYAGKSKGTREYYNSGETRAAETTVSGLPRDGSAVYVRLWYKVDSRWQYTDYSYATK